MKNAVFILILMVLSSETMYGQNDRRITRFDQIPFISNPTKFKKDISKLDLNSLEYLNDIITLEYHDIDNELLLQGRNTEELKRLSKLYPSSFINAFITYSILFHDYRFNKSKETNLNDRAIANVHEFRALKDTIGISLSMIRLLDINTTEYFEILAFEKLFDREELNNSKSNAFKTYSSGDYQQILEIKKKSININLQKLKALEYYDTRVKFAVRFSEVINRWVTKSSPPNKKTLNMLLECEKLVRSSKALTSQLGSVYTLMARYYKSIGSNKKCIEYHKKSYEAYKYANSQGRLAAVVSLGNTYRFLAKQDLALPYLLEAEKIISENNIENTRDCIVTYDNLAHVYKTQKNFEKSLEYQKKYTKGVLKLQRKATITSFKTSSLIEKINTQKKTNRNRLIVIIASLFVIALLSYILYRLDKTKKKADEQLNKNQELQKSKDQLLASISHDIVSPINAYSNLSLLLSSSLKQGKYDRITALGEKLEEDSINLTTNINSLFNWAMANNEGSLEQRNLHNPTKLIDSVLQFHKESIHARDIEIEFDSKTDLKILMNSFYFNGIIRNAVDNAIKHSPKQSKIIIKTTSDNTHFLVSISNPGKLSTNQSKLLKESDSATNSTRTYGTKIIQKFAHNLKATIDYQEINNKIIFTLSIPK